MKPKTRIRLKRRFERTPLNERSFPHLFEHLELDSKFREKATKLLRELAANRRALAKVQKLPNQRSRPVLGELQRLGDKSRRIWEQLEVLAEKPKQ